MNSYEKEIYEYFAQESNFRKMLNIAQHATTIKRELLIEFWNALLSELNKKVSESYPEWRVSDYGGITYNWGKMLIHKIKHEDRGQDGLPLVAIGIQRIMDRQYSFYGVFLNNKTNKYDVDTVIKHIRNIKDLSDYDQDNDKWWPKWQRTDLDFREEEDYVKILPENRDVTISSIYNSLFYLVEVLSDEIDKIYEMKK